MKLGSRFRFNMFCLPSEIYQFQHNIVCKQSRQFSANVKIHGFREFRDFVILV